MLDGDAILRDEVGSLPCKKIIYAVGPTWQGGGHLEDRILKRACIKSLRLAQNYESISFPAISSGLFKFPLNVCANTIIHAFCTWSEEFPHAALRDIYVIVFSQDHLPTASVVAIPATPVSSNKQKKKKHKGNPGASDDVTVSVSSSKSSEQTAHSPSSLFYRYVSSGISYFTGGSKSNEKSSHDKCKKPEVVEWSYIPPLPYTEKATTSFTNTSISSSQASQVQIKVFAKDDKAVSEAEDQLLDIIDQHCEVLPVDDPRIISLKPDQISQLTQKARQHNVNIKVEIELSRIQLRGDRNDVQIVKAVIERMLHELDTEKLKTEADATAAGLMQKKIKWQYQIDDEKFEDYDPKINYQIENAYQLYKTNRHGPVFAFKDGGVDVQILFNRSPMQEKDCNIGELTDVQRIDNEDKIKDMLKKGINYSFAAYIIILS